MGRGKGKSITGLANYISGRELYDSYLQKTFHARKGRTDVLYFDILQPADAPDEFHDLQRLCNEIDKAEARYDARTHGSLLALCRMNFQRTN